MESQMSLARAEGFKFGVKLVRGAYMTMERSRADKMGYPDPIHASLHATHMNYKYVGRSFILSFFFGLNHLTLLNSFCCCFVCFVYLPLPPHTVNAWSTC